MGEIRPKRCERVGITCRSRILGSQTDDQVAMTTAKAAVPPYDWKAAPKAAAPKDVLLQTEHILKHISRELESVRPSARLVQPPYDWAAAVSTCAPLAPASDSKEERARMIGLIVRAHYPESPRDSPRGGEGSPVRSAAEGALREELEGLKMEALLERAHAAKLRVRCGCCFRHGATTSSHLEGLVMEANELLHERVLRKPESPTVTVKSQEQIAILEEKYVLSETAIADDFKVLVNETAAETGLPPEEVRDYFASKKKMVGPELVLSVDDFSFDEGGAEPNWAKVRVGRDGFVVL